MGYLNITGRLVNSVVVLVVNIMYINISCVLSR